MVSYIIYLDKFKALTEVSLATAKERYCGAIKELFVELSKKSKKNNSNMINYFQNHVADFIECFPHGCKMRELKVKYAEKSSEEKLSIDRQIAELKEVIERKFPLPDFNYFFKLHRPINESQIIRFKSPEICDIYAAFPFDDDVTESKRLDHIFEVIPVEDSFDLLCHHLRSNDTEELKSIGCRVLWKKIDREKCYGVTFKMAQIFATAIKKEISDLDGTDDANTSNEGALSNERSVREEGSSCSGSGSPGDDNSSSSSSSSSSDGTGGKGDSNGLNSSDYEDKEVTNACEANESELQLADVDGNSNVIEEINNSMPLEGDEKIEDNEKYETIGTLSDVDALSSLDNLQHTNFTPLTFDDQHMPHEVCRNGPEERIANFPEGGEIGPEIDNLQVFPPVDLESYQDLCDHISYTEEEHAENAIAVKNAVLSCSSHDKFYHVMINVFTVKFPQKNPSERSHILCIFDLVTFFLICRPLSNPFDMVAIRIILSEVFGDNGYPKTLSYYGDGVCFQEDSYICSEDGVYRTNKNYVPETSLVVSFMNLLKIHKEIFRGIAIEEDRVILANLGHNKDLQTEFDARFLAFCKNLSDLMRRDKVKNGELSSPMPMWYGLAQQLVNCGENGRYGSAEKKSISAEKNETLSAFESYHERPVFFHKKVGDVYACCNFWESARENNDASIDDSIVTIGKEVSVLKGSESFYSRRTADAFGYPPIISPFGMSPHTGVLSLNYNSPKLEALKEKDYLTKFPVGIESTDALSSVFRLLQDMPKFNCILNETITNLIEGSAIKKATNIAVSYPLMWSYVICGRQLYEMELDESVPKKDRHIKISKFHDAFNNRVVTEHGGNRSVVRDVANDDASILLKDVLSFSFTDLSKLNPGNGKALVSLLKRKSMCQKYCSNCMACDRKERDDIDDEWLMSINVPAVIPEDCKSMVQYTDIGDCLINLSDLIRIQHSNWKVPIIGEKCKSITLREREVGIDSTRPITCSVMKMFKYIEFSHNIIVSLNRETSSNSKVKVLIPPQLDVESECNIAKYNFVSAITKDTNCSSKEEGVYRVMKKYKGKFICMSNRIWFEMEHEEFLSYLYENAIVILYELAEKNVNGPLDMGAPSEYEFTENVKKFTDVIVRAVFPSTTVQDTFHQRNMVPLPKKIHLRKKGHHLPLAKTILAPSTAAKENNCNLTKKRAIGEALSTVSENSLTHSHSLATDKKRRTNIPCESHTVKKSQTSISREIGPYEKGQFTPSGDANKKRLSTSLSSNDKVQSTIEISNDAVGSVGKHGHADDQGESNVLQSTDSAESEEEQAQKNVEVPEETKYDQCQSLKEGRKKEFYNASSIGVYDYEMQQIIFPTNNGYKKYMKPFSTTQEQPCVYCSAMTKQHWGEYTYICKFCSGLENNENKFYPAWMNEKTQKLSRMNTNESVPRCIECFTNIEPKSSGFSFHSLGEYQFCQNCIMNGNCKCIICAMTGEYPYAKLVSFLKKKHHESMEAWLQDLEAYRSRGSTRSTRSSEVKAHWTLLHKSITNYMAHNSSQTEQAVFTMINKHQNICVTMNNFETLNTADIRKLFLWRPGIEDPMTRHMMQHFIHIFQGDTILLNNNYSIEWSSDSPQTQFSTCLNNRNRTKKQFYVGLLEDSTWFAYELNFCKKDGTTSFNYFDLKHGTESEFESIKEEVMDVWIASGQDRSTLSCIGNDLSNIGATALTTSKESSAYFNSLYVVYYLINRIGGFDTEVQDKTISDLRYHFILVLLTGEPFYSIMYGSLDS